MYSSVGGHLVCFYLLAIMNKWTWMCKYLFEILPWILRCVPGSEIAGSHGSSTFNFLRNFHACVLCAKSLQSCLTLCDPMDCSTPGSSVLRIIQARILEWVAMPSFRGSSRPRDWTHIAYVSCIGRRVLYHYHHLGDQGASIQVSKWLHHFTFSVTVHRGFDFSISNSMDVSLSKLREMVKEREAWHAAAVHARVGHDWATDQQHPHQQF